MALGYFALTMNPIEVLPMTEAHWPAVREIYAQGIATRQATFETAVPSWQEWDGNHLPTCRIVAHIGDEIVGWAALSAVSQRYVYRGVAEVSVYVAEQARGKGVGTALLAALIDESERNGFWTLQAVIHARNAVSIRAHEKSGFRIVGTRQRIGCLDGRWIDTVLMERRSKLVGV